MNHQTMLFHIQPGVVIEETAHYTWTAKFSQFVAIFAAV